jgi:hypothetical protein
MKIWYVLVVVATLALLGAHRFGNSEDFAMFMIGLAVLVGVSAILKRLSDTDRHDRHDRG